MNVKRFKKILSLKNIWEDIVKEFLLKIIIGNDTVIYNVVMDENGITKRKFNNGYWIIRSCDEKAKKHIQCHDLIKFKL